MIETVAKHCIHKDCKYRGRLSFVDEACFYMLYTGERRNSPISKCDKYEAGKVKKIFTLDGVVYKNDL